jgi:hypothetical protein
MNTGDLPLEAFRSSSSDSSVDDFFSEVRPAKANRIILNLTTGKDARLRFIGKPRLIRSHFKGRKGRVCKGEKCQLCKRADSKRTLRDRYYANVLNGDDENFIFCFGPELGEKLRTIADLQGNPISYWIVIRRLELRPHQYTFEVEPEDSSPLTPDESENARSVWDIEAFIKRGFRSRIANPEWPTLPLPEPEDAPADVFADRAERRQAGEYLSKFFQHSELEDVK